MKSKRLCSSGSKDQQHEEADGEENKDGKCARPVALSPSERCPICLNSLPREIGFPQDCCHAFCISCILKWSETSTSCPVDRRPFQTIYKIDSVSGCTKIQVMARSPRENIYCDCNVCQWCCMKSKIRFRVEVKKDSTSECKDIYTNNGCRDSEEKSELESRYPRRESLCCLGGDGNFFVPAEVTHFNGH